MTRPIPNGHIHGCCVAKCQLPPESDCYNCFCRGCFRAECNSTRKEDEDKKFKQSSLVRHRAQVWFHGTNKVGTSAILANGFKENTWFARHLEDAIECGGNYVFLVKVSFKSRKWQVCCSNKIPKDKIIRLVKYEKVILKETE